MTTNQKLIWIMARGGLTTLVFFALMCALGYEWLVLGCDDNMLTATKAGKAMVVGGVVVVTLSYAWVMVLTGYEFLVTLLAERSAR